MMRSKIVGTGSYVPEKILRNADLEKMVDTSDKWIQGRTGIRERRIAHEGEAASDLGAKAAREALTAAQLDAKEVNLIIVATATPDMLFPSTACLLQKKIGASHAAAFDLSAACSGFVFALSVGDHYIRSGTYHTVLVIGTEVMSRITDWTEKGTCVLFGDGAGAAVLRGVRGRGGILSIHLHCDGALWDLISVPGGGSRYPPSPETIEKRLHFIRMKGNETFKVAVRTLEETALEALESEHLSVKDLHLFIPHQANSRIIQAVTDRLHLPPEKVMMNLDRYGNTSAASIPLALDEAVRAGRVKEGDLILLAAFGSGLTWGSALIRW